MRARPSRTVAITTTPTNIRASGNSINTRPVTYATVRYASGGGLIQLIGGSPFATGTLTFVTNPVAAETIAINGVSYTFIAGVSSGTDIHIGTTKEDTALELVNVLNASASGSINVATYSVEYGGTIVTITYDTAGTGGNAFTLANSSGTVAITRSASTLLGGQTYGDGQAVNADDDYNSIDQSLLLYAVASTGSVDLKVTDYEA